MFLYDFLSIFNKFESKSLILIMPLKKYFVYFLIFVLVAVIFICSVNCFKNRIFFSNYFFMKINVFVVNEKVQKVPIPILIVKSIEKNTMEGVQEHSHIFSYLFPCSAKVILVSFTSSISSEHSSTNLSINIFYICNFRSQNILQHHMIYHIHIHNYN